MLDNIRYGRYIVICCNEQEVKDIFKYILGTSAKIHYDMIFNNSDNVGIRIKDSKFVSYDSESFYINNIWRYADYNIVYATDIIETDDEEYQCDISVLI